MENPCSVASAILSGLSICVVGVVSEEAGVNDKVSVVGASSLVDGGNGLTFGVLFSAPPELEEFIATSGLVEFWRFLFSSSVKLFILASR